MTPRRASLLAAAAVSDPPRRSRWASSALGLPVGAATAVAALILAYAATFVTGRPSAWWPTGAAAAIGAWVRWALVFAVACAFGTVAHAAWMRRQAARDAAWSVHGIDWLCASLYVAAGAAITGIFLACRPAWTTALGAHTAALAGVAAIALAVGTLARARFARAVTGAPPASRISSAHVGAGPADPVAVLIDRTIIPTDPAYSWSPVRSTARSGDCIDRAWRSAGGEGSAPSGLRRAIAAAAAGEALVVRDLPRREEGIFVAALVIGFAYEHGGRSLVVGDDVNGFRDRLARAARGSPRWSPGSICLGAAELRDAIAARRLPAVALFDPVGFSESAIPALASDGAPFVRVCELLVVSRPDMLEPVPATHLRFALGRLRLRTDGSRALRSAVTTAAGSPEVIACIESLLGRGVTAVDPGPIARGRTRLFVANAQTGERVGAIGAAVRDARGALRGAGCRVEIEDPAGIIDTSATPDDADDLSGRSDGRSETRVVLVVAPDGGVAEVYRTAPNRAPAFEGAEIVVVLWTPRSPLSRAALEPGRLRSLHEGGVLPAPAPLFGIANAHLCRTHARAAVHEGAASEEELRRVFGDGTVRALVEEGWTVSRGTHARRERARDRVERSALLAPAPDRPRPSATRRTVTEREVEVVDVITGAVLDHIDLLTARTQYYPRRVFAAGGRRYAVPDVLAIDLERPRIVVRPADADGERTRPRIHFATRHLGWRATAVRSDRDGMQVRTAVADVEITETVSAAVGMDSGREASFDPVTARYRTAVRVVFLDHAAHATEPLGPGLAHVARTIDGVLLAHYRVREENVEVEAFPVGYDAGANGSGNPALLFIDRHVGGMGVAEAIDVEAIFRLFKWARSLMKSCRCLDGCTDCAPRDVLPVKAKQVAIRLLGG